MKDLRIVFMGTPDFAVSILKGLVKNNYNIVGVVTAPDKPAGRGRKIKESAVKTYAKQESLKIFQPTNLKDSFFVEELTQLKPDISIVVAFRMLPKVVWQIASKGTFNLHASLLPDYRGAAPIHWAIINGEKTTGVTTFFIDEKIDTGEIILKEKIEIKDNETVGTLHDKLMHLGTNLVLKTVDIIESGNIKTEKQPEKELKTAPKLTKENTKIDWTISVDEIYNKIRGLNPFPSAWTIIDNKNEEIKAQIYDVAIEKNIPQEATGCIISTKKELKVAAKDGYIIIKELKLSGRRKMDVKSLLNGFQFNKDAKVL